MLQSQWKRGLCATIVAGAAGMSALAAPILDGTKDASYGAAAAVQTVQTGFGDNFSELDAGYAQVTGGTLYLMLTGNLENNFNKLNIFIDSQAGGQNVLQADAFNGGNNPENDNWANVHAGMRFDSGFQADYMLILRNGNFGGDRFDIDYAVVGGGAGNFEAQFDVFGGTLEGSNANALPLHGIGVAFDNSNTAGIAGGSGAADPVAAQAVSTGIELAIPLAAIGSPTGMIHISAMINGSNHDFLSNQFLGGLPAGTGNLGGDGAGNWTGNLAGIDLNQYPGNQYFSVMVPEPASLSLLLLGGLALVRRR
ncbi:MAG: PEP-CTERM sorting domain-containing protein [Planctomycetota bacterium]|nr:MAG: PEP-CTERM sorting domain-containing protein [Planctomycetota bacterium]